MIDASEGEVKIIPNPERIKAVMGQVEPTSRKEVESYLGQVHALAHWFPNLNISTPNIQEAIKKGKHFSWDGMQQAEFEAVKTLLANPAILSPFDKDRSTFLYTDAARKGGMGFVLIHTRMERSS